MTFQLAPPLHCHTQLTAVPLVVLITPMAKAWLTAAVEDEVLRLRAFTPAGTSNAWTVHFFVASDHLQAGQSKLGGAHQYSAECRAGRGHCIQHMILLAAGKKLASSAVLTHTRVLSTPLEPLENASSAVPPVKVWNLTRELPLGGVAATFQVLGQEQGMGVNRLGSHWHGGAKAAGGMQFSLEKPRVTATHLPPSEVRSNAGNVRPGVWRGAA